MKIPEEFLHFVWQFRLFNQFELLSQSGEPIRVLEVGMPNRDAGPDFLFAKIRIGQTDWVGHVEIHVDAKDWERHGHGQDPAYNNVVLHIIWQNEYTTNRQDGTTIPTLNIQPYVDMNLLYRYHEIIENLTWIPCEKMMSEVPEMIKTNTLQRMLVERLEERCLLIEKLHLEFQGDWERILFILLCRSFGMKVNSEVFVNLGKMVNPMLLRKYREQPEKIEAILFGQSGLLPGNISDEYEDRLKREYAYLKQLHQLEEIELVSWRFMRMRPYNFPTYRLAQLSALYTVYPSLFSVIMEVGNIAVFKENLSRIKAAAFWETHFRFGKTSPAHNTQLTKVFIEHIVINVFAPILFSYGKSVDRADFQERAIAWLENCAVEDNAILRKFKKIGLRAFSAAESQAALHLKKHYCDAKGCLQCMIGLKLMKI